MSWSTCSLMLMISITFSTGANPFVKSVVSLVRIYSIWGRSNCRMLSMNWTLRIGGYLQTSLTCADLELSCSPIVSSTFKTRQKSSLLLPPSAAGSLGPMEWPVRSIFMNVFYSSIWNSSWLGQPHATSHFVVHFLHCQPCALVALSTPNFPDWSHGEWPPWSLVTYSSLQHEHLSKPCWDNFSNDVASEVLRCSLVRAYPR